MEVKPEKLRTSKCFPVGLITVFNPELAARIDAPAAGLPMIDRRRVESRRPEGGKPLLAAAAYSTANSTISQILVAARHKFRKPRAPAGSRDHLSAAT
jgi:hypothetical protein